jgi:RNA polymerase sigma-70 factor, ECF subfamily
VDAELVSRARAGDTAAYELLVQQHQEAMFRLAYLMLGDRDDAADIAQDALIRAFRSLDQFDVSRPLRPWLLSITANLARNRRRSLGRYWGALRRLVWLDPTPTGNVETETAQQLEAQALWKAVQQLNSTDQEIIYLRYFLELSVTETADILDVEAGTVKSRLSRALGRLRAVVEQHFPLLYEGSEV